MLAQPALVWMFDARHATPEAAESLLMCYS